MIAAVLVSAALAVSPSLSHRETLMGIQVSAATGIVIGQMISDAENATTPKETKA